MWLGEDKMFFYYYFLSGFLWSFYFLLVSWSDACKMSVCLLQLATRTAVKVWIGILWSAGTQFFQLPINSQIGRERSIFWGQSFSSSLLSKAAELSLLGKMRNTHSRRKHTHLAAVSSSMPSKNRTGGLYPQTFVSCCPSPAPLHRFSVPRDSLSPHLQ